MQKIRNQHKMRRSSSRARQPAKCVPSHRLLVPAFLGALLLVSSSISFDTTAKSNTVFVSATVSSSSMSFFGKRSASKSKIGTASAAASSIITATQTPPRGGAASTSASFAGLDADTLRSLGVDESEIGDLFLDETDGEFAAPGVSSRRQQRAVKRNAVVEDEEEDEYEWESDGDDEDGMESAEEEYDEEEEEADMPTDAFDQEYDFEEYEEYEDEDVGEEWWRNPLGRYQNDADEYDDVGEESEYEDEPSSIEEILGEEEDEEEEEAQPTQRGRNSANKKSRAAASAKGKKPSIGLPTFGGKKKASKSSSAVVKRKNSKTKSSVATTSSSSWSVPTPLGKVKVQLPAAAALGPLTTLVGSLLAKTSPTVPIILSLGLANYLLGLVRSMHPQDSAEEDVDQEYQQYNDGYQDEMNEEDYGWDQQQQEQDEDVPMDGDGDFDEYQQQEQYPEDDVDLARGPNILERLANSMPKVSSMFGRGDQTNDGEYQEQKPSRRMMRRMRRNRKRSFRRDDEVQALYERAETAEAERDTIEREYELSSKQLQGMQQQVQAISKTNTYLKAQLRDIQRSSESAVLAERKKADEEMARVRESLVDVLERERRLMRAQMMKASNRLRTLMEDEADALSEDDGQFAK